MHLHVLISTGSFGELAPVFIEHLCPLVRDLRPVAQESEFPAADAIGARGRPAFVTTERTENEILTVILVVAMEFQRRKVMCP